MPSGSFSRIDLLGMGMSILDSIQVVDQFPSGPGVTRVIDSVLMGGGPVPTALCAASKLGVSAGIIDRIGDDWRGDRIWADYEKFGVNTGHLLREKDRTSSLGTVLVRKSDGEKHLIFQEGDFTPLAPEELPLESLACCRILHLNGRHWPACVAAAQIVREHGGLVSFDGGAHRYDAKFIEIFPLVDLLIVARDFAERLSGTDEREAQLEGLSQWGARIVGITDGKNGSWFLADESARFHQPAFSVSSVIDTTGCGDVFHGAFLAEAVRGEPWAACARFAAASAAMAVTALGGRGYLPGREEVEEWMSGGDSKL